MHGVEAARGFALPALVPPHDQTEAPDAEDLVGAFASNTVRAYRSDFADWCCWCMPKGLDPLGATPGQVASYLKDLAGGGRRMSTVTRRVAAIAQAMRQAGRTFDRRAPVLDLALKSLRRKHGTAKRGMAELMTDDVKAMLGCTPATLAGARDRALLLIGFASGCRRSEIVGFTVEDMDERPGAVVFRLARSKGDQEGKGRLVVVKRGRRKATCPAIALKAWLEAAGIATGPIFRPVRGDVVGTQALSGNAVYQLVKGYAEQAGIDAARIGAHSLRVGHATQADANGADLKRMQAQLGHKKRDTTEGYIRTAQAVKESSSGDLGL